MSTPGVDPGVQIFQLDAENGALNRIHSVVERAYRMFVPLPLPPRAEQTHPVREGAVVGHRGTPFAIRAQIFRRVEAEAANISKRSHATAFVLGAVRLGGI